MGLGIGWYTVYIEPQRCKVHFYCHYKLKLAGILHSYVLARSAEKYRGVGAVQLWAIAGSSSGAGILPLPVQSLALTPWFRHKNLDPPKMVPSGKNILKYLDTRNRYFRRMSKYLDPPPPPQLTYLYNHTSVTGSELL